MTLCSGILIITLLWKIFQCSAEPYCSSVIRNPSGRIDVEGTLFNCTKNIEGSMFPPSYFASSETGKFDPIFVNISVAMNTLINVDDVNAQVTLDVYFRMYWHDTRLKLPPEVWKTVNPVSSNYEGLELTPYVRSQNPLQIWLPDIQIMEAVNSNTMAELIHLFQDGSIFWSRHMVVTLTQPKMDLHEYPNDDQTFSLTFQSFAYSDDYVLLQPIASKGYVGFNNARGKDIKALSMNRLWTYDSYSTVTVEDKSEIFFHPARRYSTVIVELRFIRQNFGILLRMIFPVMIFMIVVSFTFWADIDKRIDVSVQMLLVVSSLYFVISQIIPFVGYFTVFDKFIVIFFGILGGTIGIHFVTYQLDRLQHEYPMALAFKEIIVLSCRVGALPLSIGIMYLYFPAKQDYFLIPVSLVLIFVVCQGLASYTDVVRVCNFVICKIRHMHKLRSKKDSQSRSALNMDTVNRPSEVQNQTEISSTANNVKDTEKKKVHFKKQETGITIAPLENVDLPSMSSPQLFRETNLLDKDKQQENVSSSFPWADSTTFIMNQVVQILLSANTAIERTIANISTSDNKMLIDDGDFTGNKKKSFYSPKQNERTKHMLGNGFQFAHIRGEEDDNDKRKSEASMKIDESESIRKAFHDREIYEHHADSSIFSRHNRELIYRPDYDNNFMLSDEEILTRMYYQADHNLFGRKMELQVLRLSHCVHCCDYHNDRIENKQLVKIAEDLRKRSQSKKSMVVSKYCGSCNTSYNQGWLRSLLGYTTPSDDEADVVDDGGGLSNDRLNSSPAPSSSKSIHYSNHSFEERYETRNMTLPVSVLNYSPVNSIRYEEEEGTRRDGNAMRKESNKLHGNGTSTSTHTTTSAVSEESLKFRKKTSNLVDEIPSNKAAASLLNAPSSPFKTVNNNHHADFNSHIENNDDKGDGDLEMNGAIV